MLHIYLLDAGMQEHMDGEREKKEFRWHLGMAWGMTDVQLHK